MLNLGQIQFGLGVDTRGLQQAADRMRNFGRQVDASANAVGDGARRTEAALRRQEAATVRGLNAVLRLNQQIRRTVDEAGRGRLIRETAAAFGQLTDQLTRGERPALAYQRAMESFQTRLARVNRELANHRAAAEAARRGTTGFGSAMRDLSSATVLAIGPLSGFGARISALSAVSNRSGFALAALVGTVIAVGAAFAKMSSSAIRTALDIQRIESRLVSLTGANELAQIEFDRLQQLAHKTGLNFVSLADQYTRFMAASQGTALEGEKSAEIFENIAVAIGKFQLDAASAEGVFRALEQIMSKGTVAAEEIRQQLGDRLPGAFKAAADAMGVTTAQFNKLLKKGKIASDQFLLPFSREVRKRLAGDGVDSVDSLRASINRLDNAFTNFNIAFDEAFGISRAFKGAVEGLTNILNFLSRNITTVAASVGAFAGVLALVTAPRILAGIFGIGRGVAFAAAAFIGLNAAMFASPIGALLGVVLRVGAAIAGAAIGLGLFSSQMNQASAAEIEMKVKSDALIDSQESMGKTVSETANEYIKAAQIKVAAIQMEIEAQQTAFKIQTALLEQQLASNKALQLIHESSNKFMNDLAKRTAAAGGKPLAPLTGPEITFGPKMAELNTQLAEAQNRLAKLQEIANKPTTKPGGIGLGDEPDKGALKAIREATQAIDALIERNIAMQKGPQAFQMFERQEEINKKISDFKDRLVDAEVPTQVITDKVNQYTFALEYNRQITEGVFAAQTQLYDGLKNTAVSAFDSIGSALADSIVEGELNAQAFVDIVKNMAKQIIQQILKLAVINPILNSLFPGSAPLPSFGSGGGGLLSGLFARGGAFKQGVRFMAKGDILNRPTLFGTSSGPAVGGEAGTEAVLPLARTASGNLGVHAAGGGASQDVQINIYNNSGEQVQTKRRRGSGGQEVIDLVIGAVKQKMAKGEFDTPMSRYGLAPTRRRT